jgi:RecB family exonuclease
VISPRRTRLVRVPDPHAFRAAIRSLAVDAVDAAIVVPTRAAARLLESSLACDASAASSSGPLVVTRDELYDLLHARLSSPPRRLTAIERDVLAQASARRAVSEHGASFHLRPGLVAEILRFYDQVRRHGQQIDRFETLIQDALGSEELDRAATRMRQQTRVLAAAFREYERRVQDSGACDEHLLRERLIAEPASNPLRRVVVTVADWIADPNGLYAADFDLLARVPGLLELDVVATERVLGSGFHQRVHDWLPGLEEVGGVGGSDDLSGRRPTLLVPDGASDALWWTYRDREEELVAVARRLKADRRRGDALPLDRIAVVFKHPLPYLYLAAEVFGAAGVPHQAADGLPLAAEPTAAAFDLVLDVVESDFNRESLVSLLRSPHLRFTDADIEVPRSAVAALDRALSEARHLGDLARLEALALEWPDDGPAAPALRAAVHAARELAPLAEPAPASAQIDRVITFWDAHARPIADAETFAPRERRARAAILEALSALAAAHAEHDDPSWAIGEVAIALRRAIEGRTFDPERAQDGIRLVDDQAARYGDFDEVAIVGLVESDWPEHERRNIFYPPTLLRSLGWPPERDRRAADDAHFLNLLTSASVRASLSAFTLDDDALVPPSLQLDLVPRARMSTAAPAGGASARVFVDEALALDPVTLAPLGTRERLWADMRLGRSPADADRFHGSVGLTSVRPSRPWSVSAIETYLACPFKFFAQHVLKLEEEPDDEEMADPRRQGQLVHEVFESFFASWQAAGYGAIAPDNLDAARTMFAAAADRVLAGRGLSDAEAGLERSRLLGSPAAAGLGEAVIRMEAERPTPVVKRLLEHPLEGEFVFATADGPRRIRLRGKADRLDLLGDGTFRLIDYKLGWPPDRSRALQLPVYSLCAEQALADGDRDRWTLGEAAYLAFKGPRRVVPLFKSASERDEILAKAQQRLADTIDAIEAGRFPPTPDDVYRCESCQFAAVCRRDYVGDV